MRTTRTALFLGLTATSLLAGCGERQPCPAPGTDEGLVARLDVALGTCNLAPEVRASGRRQVSKGTLVELDAAPTTDANGDELRYTWALVSKPPASAAVLATPSARTVSFLADTLGVFVLSLEVTDGELTAAAAPIEITVLNDAPVADAGSDLSVELGATAALDGSGSSDVNGDPLGFAWSVVGAPIGSQVVLVPADAALTSFVADVRGVYELSLEVSDGVLRSTDTVTVRAGISANVPRSVATSPTATVAVGDLVRVDGGSSFDADGDALTYRWQLTLPANSQTSLDDPTAVSPTFLADQPGEYLANLVVADGYHQSAVATVVVTAFGDPRIRCTNTVPFTESATLAGTTVGAGNDYETGCGPAGQPDVVLEYTVPTDLDTLDVSVVAGFDAVLGVYVDDCGPAARRACVNGRESSASLGRVRAGQKVAIIVDGGAANASGTYQVALSGRIASAQACSPGNTSFTCDLGTCAELAGVARCPAILDCVDGVDVDNDGALDEDACTSAPTLTCPADLRVDVLGSATLTATQTSTSPIIRRRWTVEEEPLGSSLVPTPRDAPRTVVRPLLYGDYRLRYTEIDEDLEASSCEVLLAAGTQDALRVELIWNPTIPEELHASDVDLHLLHPDATAWWGDLDCHYANRNPAWDEPLSTEDDPRLDLDDTSGRGPENINVLAPPLGETYRVGAHYYSDHGYGTSAVYVNVYCHSQLSQRFGPVTLSNDQFWKIADVTVHTSSCAIAPLGRPGAALIVSEDDSRTAR